MKKIAAALLAVLICAWGSGAMAAEKIPLDGPTAVIAGKEPAEKVWNGGGKAGESIRQAEEDAGEYAAEKIPLDGPTAVIAGEEPAEKVWNGGGKAGRSIRLAQGDAGE